MYLHQVVCCQTKYLDLVNSSDIIAKIQSCVTNPPLTPKVLYHNLAASSPCVTHGNSGSSGGRLHLRTQLYFYSRNPFTKPICLKIKETKLSSKIHNSTKSQNNGYPRFRPNKAKHKFDCLIYNPSFTSFLPLGCPVVLSSVRGDSPRQKHCPTVQVFPFVYVERLSSVDAVIYFALACALAHRYGQSSCCWSACRCSLNEQQQTYDGWPGDSGHSLC